MNIRYLAILTLAATALLPVLLPAQGIISRVAPAFVENRGNEDESSAEPNLAELRLTAPVGGEYWCAGSTQRFTWTSSAVDSVRIEISDDEGFSFAPLSPTLAASSGAWDWTIPEDQPYGFFYTFRVIAATNPSLADTADSSMTIDLATTIIADVDDQQVCPGERVVLSVVAFGEFPLYQWRKNGQNIAGATADTFVIASAQPSDSGYYSVVVTGSCNETITSRDAHVVVETAVTTLTSPPIGRIACTGDTVTLNVGARGSSLTFRWRHNGVEIPGETDTLLLLAGVDATDSGDYDVVISSSCANPLTTPPARLTVNRATVIGTQPVPRVVRLGDSVSFSAAATGSGLTWQWRHNGVEIPGATLPIWNIAAVTPADTGIYDVVVGGNCGADVVSNPATLSLEPVTSVPGVPNAPAINLTAHPNPSTGLVTSEFAGTLFDSLHEATARNIPGR